MTKKNWSLLFFAVALAMVYAVWFSDWFRPKTIRISYTTANRNLGTRLKKAQDVPHITFCLDPESRLTEIKVVPLAEWQTNHHVIPLWHLDSTSNSIPVKLFNYGQRIRGMKPAVAGDSPGSLDTNVVYRIFITAGRIQGEHDFELK